MGSICLKSYSYFFAGRMDTVAIYKQALPAWRIARMANNYGAADPCSTSQETGYGDLVNCWKFDESSGATAAATAGSGYAAQNGTLQSMASPETGQSGWARDYREDMFINCKLGGCMAFDGTDDYISIADHADLEPTGDMSFAMWVNPSTLTKETLDQSGTLISKGSQYVLSLVQNTANDGLLGIKLANPYDLVTNGNFESGTVGETPTGWTGAAWDKQAYFTCGGSCPCTDCGTYAAELYNNVGQNMTQSISVVADVQYTLSAKMLKDGGTAYIDLLDETYECTLTLTPTNAWTQLSCNFTPNVTETTTLRVRCEVPSAQFCQVDNVKVTPTTSSWSTTESPISVYQDNHIAVTIDTEAGATDTIKFYVNGTLYQSWSNQAWIMPTDSSVFAIGADLVGSIYYLGRMDDVRMYNSLLSQSDVTTMYNSGTGTECTGDLTGNVLCIKLNEQTGTTVADTTGTVNTTAQNGTLTNMGPYKAISGWNGCQFGTTCTHLDGNNDYFETPWQTAELNPTTAWTIEGWVYREQAGVEQELISKYITSAGGYDVKINSSNQLVGSVSTGSWQSCTSTGTIAAGVWTHFAAEWSDAADTITCYIGGSLDGQTTGVTGTAVTSAGELVIGARGSDRQYGLGGRLQEVRIWNTARGTTDINAKKSTACDTGWSGLKACWPMTDMDRLQEQAVNQTGLGNDSNTCYSNDTSASSTPCKTIQAVIGKIPHYYSGDATIHFASGWHAPAAGVGFNPAGDYNMTAIGYINKTGNQFSDDAGDYSGTASATATNNFPYDERTVFTGAASSNFGRNLDFQILKITGGTGYIDDSSTYTYRNWFRIECPFDITPNACDGKSDSLSVVGKWVDTDFSGNSFGLSALPLTDTTYKVYNGKYMSTIHGEGWWSGNRGTGTNGYSILPYTNALYIESSTGLKLQKLRIKGSTFGLRLTASRLSELSVYDTIENSYKGLYMDDRTTIVKQMKGNLSYNMGEGASYHMQTNVPTLAQNIFGHSYQLAGVEILWGSNILETATNLFIGNSFAGFDLEQISYAYFFDGNRIAYNGMGVGTTHQGTHTTFVNSNVLIGNNVGQDVVGAATALQAAIDAANMIFKDNEIGLNLRRGGVCMFNQCKDYTYIDNRIGYLSAGSNISVSPSISSESSSVLSKEIQLYTDESTNRVGGSAADCALVARLYGGTEIEVAILVTDGVCP